MVILTTIKMHELGSLLQLPIILEEAELKKYTFFQIYYKSIYHLLW